MNDIERIIDQLKRTFDGRTWYGPSLMALLSEVKVEEATARSLPGRHTIWEITLHINAWREYVIKALKDEFLDGLPDEINWPHINDPSQEAWEQTLAEIKKIQDTLLEAFTKFDSDKLDDTVPGAPYKFYHMLNGIIHHDIYHAGQIAILRKK